MLHPSNESGNPNMQTAPLGVQHVVNLVPQPAQLFWGSKLWDTLAEIPPDVAGSLRQLPQPLDLHIPDGRHDRSRSWSMAVRCEPGRDLVAPPASLTSQFIRPRSQPTLFQFERLP
jgi:hypothetical protein